jgi:hypothetical protein
MNLTLIKNFFLSDRKSVEPKVSRVLRRSFRMKRSKHVLEGNREKRKSGKLFEIPMHSSSKMITHLSNDSHPNFFIRRFIRQQPRMDDIASRA